MATMTQALTGYFRQVQTLANLEDRRFDSKTPHVTVPYEAVSAGRLPEETVAELYRLERQPTSKPLDIIISVVTLHTSRSAEGLVLVAGSVTADGVLSVDLEGQPPWIPASRLTSRFVEDREVMAASLADFWRWRLGPGQQRASRAEDWDDVLAYLEDLADSVLNADLLAAGLAGERGGELHRPGGERQNCWITPGTQIMANGAILDLYRHLAEVDEAPALFGTLLDMQDQDRASEDGIDEDPERLRQSALATGGSMSDRFPLTASQRRAVHAFMHDGDGQVTAVSGPPGTGKTTMLQTVVASLLVQHALEGRPAPLIVGTSTNNQAVTNIIDSFSSVSGDDPGALGRRWLPEAAEDGAGSGALRGLAAYAPSKAKAQEARAKGYLIEDHRKGGVYSEHSTPGYVEAAVPRFLADMADYARAVRLPAPTNLAGAESLLGKILEMADQSRRRLIEVRAAADRAIPVPQTEDWRARAEQVGEQLARCRGRLDYWEQADASGAGDALAVSLVHEASEPVPRIVEADGIAHELDAAGLAERYRELIVELGWELDDVVRAAAVREEAEREATGRYAAEAGGDVATVTRLCVLSAEQALDLTSAPSLLDLDRVLDVTVRHALFWLAVHRYEAQWLIACAEDEIIAPNERRRTARRYMDTYWPQAAALTPCFVMTAYQLPKYFAMWSRDGEDTPYDLERADLLIVDEAGQVDTSLGAAAFALAKRALVVGDVQQLAPVWGIDPESDRLMGAACGLGDHWPALEERGLTASDHSSLMQAAAVASRWAYGPDDDPGLFLSEHFRCRAEIIEYCNRLLYKGQLIPSRPEKGYELEGHVPGAFLFREVPGSEDARRGSSRVNAAEASAIAAWIEEHFDHFCAIYGAVGDPAKEKSVFGVVTPFAAQARVIREELAAVLGPERAGRVTVGTAHTLQGAERSIVLFSPVYGDNSGTASFIDSTLELMNVAVSRAKDLFIVFGAKQRWNDGGPVFRLVRQMAIKDDCSFVGLAAEGAGEGVSGDEPHAATPEIPATVGETPVEAVEKGLVATAMIAAWKDRGALPAGASLSAKSLNQALLAAGLLEKTDRGWVPTEQGAGIGILAYEGLSDTGPFWNVKYTPRAQEKIAAMIADGSVLVS